MADTEFKGKLMEASLIAHPEVITTPEENAIRAKTWEGIEVYSPPLSWVELTDMAEKACDFTPFWEVDDGRVYDHWDEYLPDFEGLDECYYDSKDYVTPEKGHTTDIPESDGKYGDRFRPSEWYSRYLETIKYGKGLNLYWRLNSYNSKVISENKTKRGKKVGNLTKEECPSKKRGYALSNEELEKRAEGTGKQARNARLLLKQRKERLK